MKVKLTPRETDIIGLIALGLSNKEIAVKLDIAVNTVKVHVKNILRKLELDCRGKLINFYFNYLNKIPHDE